MEGLEVFCQQAFQLQESLPQCWELVRNESVVSETFLLMEPGLPHKPQRKGGGGRRPKLESLWGEGCGPEIEL